MSEPQKTPSQTPKRVRIHTEPGSASRAHGLPLKSPAHVNAISLGLATPSTPSSVKKTKIITPLDIIKSSGTILSNSSASWEDRGQALLMIGQTIQTEDFKAIKADEHRYTFALDLLKTLVFPRISSQISDPRAQVCRDACRMVSEVVTELKDDAQLLVEQVAPALMKTLCSPKKVFVTFANNALLTILKDCNLVFLLEDILQGTGDKNPVLRERSCHYLLVGLKKYSAEDLETPEMRLDAILKSIKDCIADSKPEVRDMAFNCAQAIEGHWKDKYDAMVQSLDPTTSKQFAAMEAKKKNTPKPSSSSSLSGSSASALARGSFIRSRLAAATMSAQTPAEPINAPTAESTPASDLISSTTTAQVITTQTEQAVEVQKPKEEDNSSPIEMPLLTSIDSALASTPSKSLEAISVVSSETVSFVENVENFLVTPLKLAAPPAESPLVSATSFKAADWDSHPGNMMSSTPLVEKKKPRMSVDSPLFAIPTSTPSIPVLDALEPINPIVISEIQAENDTSLLVEPVEAEISVLEPAVADVTTLEASTDLVLDENVLSEALEAINLNNAEVITEETPATEEIVDESVVVATPIKPSTTSAKSLIDCSLMELDESEQNAESTMTLRLATDGTSLLGDFDFSFTATPAKARKSILNNILLPELVIETPEPILEEKEEEEEKEELEVEETIQETAAIVPESVEAVIPESAEATMPEEEVTASNLTGALRVVMQQQDGEELMEEEICVSRRARGFSLSTIDEMSEPYSPQASPRMSILSQLDMMPRENYIAEDWNTPSKATSTPARLSIVIPSMPSLAEELIGEAESENEEETAASIAKELVLEYQTIPQQEVEATSEESQTIFEQIHAQQEKPESTVETTEVEIVEEIVLDVAAATEEELAPLSLHEEAMLEEIQSTEIFASEEQEQEQEQEKEDDDNSLDFSSTIAAALESTDMDAILDFDDAIDNEFSSHLSHRASTSLGFDPSATELLSSSPVASSSLEENIATILSSTTSLEKEIESDGIEAIAEDIMQLDLATASPSEISNATPEKSADFVIIEETTQSSVEPFELIYEDEIAEEADHLDSVQLELAPTLVAPPPSPDDSVEQVESQTEEIEEEAIIPEAVEDIEAVEAVEVAKQTQFENAVDSHEEIAKVDVSDLVEEKPVQVEAEIEAEPLPQQEDVTPITTEETFETSQFEEIVALEDKEAEIVEEEITVSIEEDSVLATPEETVIEDEEKAQVDAVMEEEKEDELALEVCAMETDESVEPTIVAESEETTAISEHVLEETSITTVESAEISCEDLLAKEELEETEELISSAAQVELEEMQAAVEFSSNVEEEEEEQGQKPTLESQELEASEMAVEEQVAVEAAEVVVESAEESVVQIEEVVESAMEVDVEANELVAEHVSSADEEELDSLVQDKQEEAEVASTETEEPSSTLEETAVQSELSEEDEKKEEEEDDEEEIIVVEIKPKRGGKKATAAKKATSTRARGKIAAAAPISAPIEEEEEEENVVVEETVVVEEEEQQEASTRPARGSRSRATSRATTEVVKPSAATKRPTRGRGKSTAAMEVVEQVEEKEEEVKKNIEETEESPVVEEPAPAPVTSAKRGGRAKKAVAVEPVEQAEEEPEIVDEVKPTTKTAKRTARGRKATTPVVAAAAEEIKEEEEMVEPEVVVEEVKPAKRTSARGKKSATPAPTSVEEIIEDAKEEENVEPEFVVEEVKPAKRTSARGKNAAAVAPTPVVIEEIQEEKETPVPEVVDAKPAKRTTARGKKNAAPVPVPEPVAEEEKEEVPEVEEEEVKPTIRGRAKPSRAKSAAAKNVVEEDDSQKENGSSNITVAPTSGAKKTAKKSALPAKATATVAVAASTKKAGLALVEENKPSTPIANRVRTRVARK